MPLWQANAISVLLFMATVASIILVGLAASASKRERARPFAVLQAAVFVWCFFAYLQFRVDSFGERFAYLQYGYLGVLVLPCAAFAFGRALDKRPLSLVQVLLLGLFPLVTAFFVLDPANTGLFWRAGQGTEALAVRLGPWFWLDVLYSYVLITLLVVSVLRSYRRSAGLARRWLRHSMSLFLLPGLASLYFLVSLLLSARPGFPFGLLSGLADHGLAPLDPTPIVFGLTGVFVALALGRFNMLDSIPFSKEQVFDAMSDPIITIDDEGRIIGSNRNAGALFASSLPLEGLLLAGLCPATAGLLGGGEGHWLAAGRAYDIVVRPVAMRRGRLRGGGVVIFYDVTERVRAQGELGEREEALRRYAFIANASRESMSIVNRDLRFEAVNDAFCEGYGRSREEVVGACVTDLWQDNAGLGDILGGYETCLRGEAAVARLSHDFGDGRGGRDLELSFYPYRSTTGEVTHAVLVSKDVTDYLETQRELSSARERADASNEAKGSFLASMSHEIRTPLNAIIGLTELSLREEHTGGMAAELRDNLETVRGAAHGLLELINDILDLSKIEAGRLTLERVDFDLPAKMAALLKPFRRAAGQKGLFLDLVVEEGVPVAVAGDPVKLGQIVTNIVGNAIKFTEKGGVTISLGPLPPDARPGPGPGRRHPEEDPRRLGVRVSVKDTGIGVSPDKQKLIFESFSQADSSVSRRFGGTGLGLSISRGLALRLGGDISVVSRPGEGSVFTFTAFFEPGDPERAASRSRIAATPGSLQGPRLDILLVEDNPVNAKVALRWLSQEGHRPRRVATGAEALAALAGSRFDLVLLDLELPDFSGLEVARRVRSGDAGPAALPIVAMSAHSGAEARAACEAAGMDDYVAKPLDFGELAATLARVLPPPSRPETAPVGGAGPVAPPSRPPTAPTAPAAPSSPYPTAPASPYPTAPSSPQPAARGAGEVPAPVGGGLLIASGEPLRRLGGDEELYLEILGIFAAEAAGRRASFEAAFSRGDAEGVRRQAHSLRGTAKTVGAETLAALAAALEEALAIEGSNPAQGPDAPVSRAGLDGLGPLYERTLALLDATALGAKSLLPPGFAVPVEE